MTWIDVVNFLLYPPWWFCVGFFALALGYYTLKSRFGIEKQPWDNDPWDYI